MVVLGEKWDLAVLSTHIRLGPKSAFFDFFRLENRKNHKVKRNFIFLFGNLTCKIKKAKLFFILHDRFPK